MKEQHTPSAKDAPNKSIGEFVAEDYRTAQVFEKYGIDFCCGGKVSLSETCRRKGIANCGVGMGFGKAAH